jgi:hypothetical protein
MIILKKLSTAATYLCRAHVYYLVFIYCRYIVISNVRNKNQHLKIYVSLDKFHACERMNMTLFLMIRLSSSSMPPPPFTAISDNSDVQVLLNYRELLLLKTLPFISTLYATTHWESHI